MVLGLIFLIDNFQLSLSSRKTLLGVLVVNAIVDKLLKMNESNRKGQILQLAESSQWDNLHKQIHIFIENILI